MEKESKLEASSNARNRKCRFGTRCNILKCEFLHDDCPLWAKCQDVRCTFRHPPWCKNGDQCEFGPRCLFRHQLREFRKKVSQQSPHEQKAPDCFMWSKCQDVRCKFQHPDWCKHREKCKKGPSCIFRHLTAEFQPQSSQQQSRHKSQARLQKFSQEIPLQAPQQSPDSAEDSVSEDSQVYAADIAADSAATDTAADIAADIAAADTTA